VSLVKFRVFRVQNKQIHFDGIDSYPLLEFSVFIFGICFQYLFSVFIFGVCFRCLFSVFVFKYVFIKIALKGIPALAQSNALRNKYKTPKPKPCKGKIIVESGKLRVDSVASGLLPKR
jgi:hypothetical protein